MLLRNILLNNSEIYLIINTFNPFKKHVALQQWNTRISYTKYLSIILRNILRDNSEIYLILNTYNEVYFI